MSQNRRKFLKFVACSAAAIPALRVINPSDAFAADEVIKLDNPTAKALGYVHDASKVDAAKSPKYKEGQLCSNCRFAQGEAKELKSEKGSWVACQLFPGKLVNNEGWCNSWTAAA